MAPFLMSLMQPSLNQGRAAAGGMMQATHDSEEHQSHLAGTTACSRVQEFRTAPASVQVGSRLQGGVSASEAEI